MWQRSSSSFLSKPRTVAQAAERNKNADSTVHHRNLLLTVWFRFEVRVNQSDSRSARGWRRHGHGHKPNPTTARSRRRSTTVEVPKPKVWFYADGVVLRRRRQRQGLGCPTPKAFANFSPGLEPCDNPGIKQPPTFQRCKRWRVEVRPRQRLQRCDSSFVIDPGLFQPWARICKRLRRCS
jgi:hypothetical protein